MQKVAVVFFGLTGGTGAKFGLGEQLDPSISAEPNLANLIVPNNADVFIHTWSVSSQAALSNLYNPIKIVAEEQPYELWSSALRSLSRPKWWLRLALRSLSARNSNLKGELRKAQNAFMRFLSHDRALSLVNEHAQATGIEYSAVILTRLDVAHLTPFQVGALRPGEVLVSNWNGVISVNGSKQGDRRNLKLGRAYLDLWFGFHPDSLHAAGQISPHFFSYDYNQHRLIFQHLQRAGFTPVFERYRWTDYELARRYFLGAEV